MCIRVSIEAAGRGQGGLLLIEGRAGVGKTRLLQEVLRYAENRGWLVLRGTCQEVRQPPPFRPWVEALRPLHEDLPRRRLAGVSRHVLADLSLLLPELRRLFPDLPAPLRQPLSEQKNQLQQVLLRFLVELARGCPLLLALEDLQWADEATVEALAQVALQVRDAPLLCCGTARSEGRPHLLGDTFRHLEAQGALQRLPLADFSLDDTARLAGEMLSWHPPDPRFAGRLYQETQGNPFFIIEVLKGLYEEGLLRWDPRGQWDVSRIVRSGDELDWPLPRGMRQAVQRRLERIPPRGMHLLEIMAVLGNETDLDLLRRASGWKKAAVLESTDDLLRRQLLVESGDDLRFAHEVFRQVIYRGIHAARRRELHDQAGQALAHLHPERVEELAQHFFLARRPAQALPYCLQAGERSVLLYAPQSARMYYSWAIETARQGGGADRHRALLAAHEGRGKVNLVLGDYGQAMADFVAMRQAAEAAGDRPAVARAVRRQAWLRGDRLGQWEEALHGTQQALELARQAGSKRETAIALLDVGACHNMRGEPQAALAALQEALALAEETHDSGARAASLQYLTATYSLLGDYAQALAVSQESHRIWRSREDRRRTATTVLADQGLLHIAIGNLDEAARCFSQVQEEIEELGLETGFPTLWVGRAALYRWQGEHTAGLQALDQAEAMERSLGQHPYSGALLRFQRGLSLWDQGGAGPALASLRQALAQARQSGALPLVAEVLCGLGSCLGALGAPEARAHFREALSIARQTSFPAAEVAAMAGLGRIEVACGSLAEGLHVLEQALRRARFLGRPAQAESLAALAAGCLAGWDLHAARALAGRALRLAEGMPHRPLLVQSLSLLGQAQAELGCLHEAERALRRALVEAGPAYPLPRWQVLLALSAVLAEAGRPAEAELARAQAGTTVAEIQAGLEEPALRAAFGSMPLVHALLGGQGPLPPGQGRREMARLGAPTGRPLRPGEQVAVIWSAAPAFQGPGKGAARRAHLLRLLSEARAQGGDPAEEDLAQALGVSARTVRSDVAALRAEGRPVRTRGTRRAR